MVAGAVEMAVQVGVNLVRSGILTANELRQELGYDTHPDGDKLVMQASGGRPPGTDDGQGDDAPDPGVPGRTNGAGRDNGCGCSLTRL